MGWLGLNRSDKKFSSLCKPMDTNRLLDSQTDITISTCVISMYEYTAQILNRKHGC
jgi:hypothetical protein